MEFKNIINDNNNIIVIMKNIKVSHFGVWQFYFVASFQTIFGGRHDFGLSLVNVTKIILNI